MTTGNVLAGLLTGGTGSGMGAGGGHGVVAAQFTGAWVCSTELWVFWFWVGACSPAPKLDWGGSSRGERLCAVMETTAMPGLCIGLPARASSVLSCTGFVMGTSLEVPKPP